jgi:succinate dehydrogenase/fumarate reductase flavoprotein subunit
MSPSSDPSYDVIVVGGGGAGLAAASEAARLGRRVALVEKEAELGGSTAWSVGSISATRTPHQRRKGIEDSPEAHFEDLEILAGAYAARDNRVLRRILVEHTTELIEWLMSLGLEFVGPNDEPPHRVPRMHNVVPNSRAFPYHLGRHCRRLGVEIHCGMKAERLLRDGGRIAGIVARQGGRTFELRACCGVVLAGGDFSASPELKARLANPLVAALEPVNPAATGDAFPLALAEGAEIVNGDIVRGPIMRFVPPRRDTLLRRLPPNRALARAMRWGSERLPAALLRPLMMGFLVTALGPSTELFKAGAILVNRAGRRFADELQIPARFVPAQPDKIAFILFDAAIAARFDAWPYFVSTAPGIAYAYLADYRRNRPDLFHRGDTIVDLARSLGVSPEALAATVTNAATLSQPPFFALGPVKSYVVFTDGGLRVTERLEVVGPGGAPIPGLFAAGSTGQGGLLLEGHGHHLGWAFISGRIAGRRAAENSGTAQPNEAAEPPCGPGRSRPLRIDKASRTLNSPPAHAPRERTDPSTSPASP